MSIKKIVVIGPESTGKSTLSKALASELHTQWVPEYARDYLTQLKRPYAENDLLHMAKMQIEQEERQAKKAHRYLVCDTDLYVFKVWSEHSYNRCDRWILEQIAIRKYDLYLLTDIDMPWEEDPLREHGNIYWRNYFYHQYKDIVMNNGVPWVSISGNEENRLQKALQCLQELF